MRPTRAAAGVGGSRGGVRAPGAWEVLRDADVVRAVSADVVLRLRGPVARQVVSVAGPVRGWTTDRGLGAPGGAGCRGAVGATAHARD